MRGMQVRPPASFHPCGSPHMTDPGIPPLPSILPLAFQDIFFLDIPRLHPDFHLKLPRYAKTSPPQNPLHSFTPWCATIYRHPFGHSSLSNSFEILGLEDPGKDRSRDGQTLRPTFPFLALPDSASASPSQLCPRPPGSTL